MKQMAVPDGRRCRRKSQKRGSFEDIKEYHEREEKEKEKPKEGGRRGIGFHSFFWPSSNPLCNICSFHDSLPPFLSHCSANNWSRDLRRHFLLVWASPIRPLSFLCPSATSIIWPTSLSAFLLSSSKREITRPRREKIRGCKRCKKVYFFPFCAAES